MNGHRLYMKLVLEETMYCMPQNSKAFVRKMLKRPVRIRGIKITLLSCMALRFLKWRNARMRMPARIIRTEVMKNGELYCSSFFPMVNVVANRACSKIM